MCTSQMPTLLLVLSLTFHYLMVDSYMWIDPESSQILSALNLPGCLLRSHTTKTKNHTTTDPFTLVLPFQSMSYVAPNGSHV